MYESIPCKSIWFYNCWKRIPSKKKTTLPSLKKSKILVLDPWSQLKTIDNEIKEIEKIKNKKSHLLEFKINKKIAQENTNMIDQSGSVLAVLDGSDVDSGVSAEIGYAYSQNKKIFGLRTDFRQTGDNIGSIVNLQVEFFITDSGGKNFDNLQDAQDAIKYL